MEKLNEKIKEIIYKKESFHKSVYSSLLLIKYLFKNKDYNNLIKHLLKFIFSSIILIFLILILLIAPFIYLYFIIDTLKGGYVFRDYFMMLIPLFLLLGSIEYLLFKLFLLTVSKNSKNNLYVYSNINVV